MESSATTQKTFMQPKPISELLPNLRGILSQDAIQTLTARKQPRTTMAQSRTAEKIKPMTLAEMRVDLMALLPNSSRRRTQAATSTKKKTWNNSVKVENKVISHTANGEMKNNPVRKVLNFQPKPKAIPNSRTSLYPSETPKFPKPDFRAKKQLHLQAKNNVRISGVYSIPKTPVETSKPVVTKFVSGNKENNPYHINVNKKLLPPPTPLNQKDLPFKMVIDTPHSNSSWRSGSDESFLQKEKEIHDVEEKIHAYTEEQTLERIEEVSPPVSTPFKEYRSVQDYFNNSSTMENSAVYNDNTIMCFDKPSVISANDRREESVIVSLCDLFTKAAVTDNPTQHSTELDKLLEVEKQTEHNITMIESGIQILNNIKDTQLKSLQNVRKLIDEKRDGIDSESENNKTLVAQPKTPKVVKISSPDKSPIISRPCSVIKSSKSPCYKIPKKNLCLRKKVFCKSMPDVSTCIETPVKDIKGKASTCIETPVKDIKGKALNMYMEMKEQMKFLSTPMVNRQKLIPDTPTVTSHNLQKQLDKLYRHS